MENKEREEESLKISDKEISKEEAHSLRLSHLYKNWFLDYASYVILERAVPSYFDGLKPVQRRILHAMKRLDDGRFNKVANIIGHTMQFHPHGDASIGDALVQLGQKNVLIETQGNWGNILTGDSAAAPRYIEARLSKFAIEVAFNPKTTEWKLSYDGRNKEPVNLPVKFPLLLAQGAEGIAVGLASKILPHNFNELLEACVLYLQNKDFELYPDFPGGGMIDVSKYNDGIRGGRVRIRAKISKSDKKMLTINELPFGKTTESLIDSILSANEKGKIKIRKIDDNTAENVEILVHLSPGTSPDKTIDALYAFTDCEISISPNSCVIDDNKPRFLGVSQLLKHSANHTLHLLKSELKIRLSEINEEWHFASLEKIFIENRIYRDIEICETWNEIIKTIDKGLEPFKPKLKREVVHDDIVRLTEIRIKRISKYNAFKADEHIKALEEEMKEVNYNIEHIVDYTIKYFKDLKKKYGKGRERKTEIRNFDVIEATKVVVANEKLYINREEGFIGTGLKKDEYVCDCSDIDDIIVFRKDGKYLVTKVSEKAFVGKNIIYANVFKKNDARTIYNVIYQDGKGGRMMVKRFAVKAITRDREYDLTKGKDGSKVMYFTANPNGEAEVVKVYLRPKPRLKSPTFEFDFSELAVKGRNAKGNILTKHAVHKILLKEKGISTLGGRKIWFDPIVQRLNVEKRGKFLGEFSGDDQIVEISKAGYFTLRNFDLSNHFEAPVMKIDKFNPRTVYSAIFFDADKNYKNYYVKRFQVENDSTTRNKKYEIIGEHPKSELIDISSDQLPQMEVNFGGEHKNRDNEVIDVNEFIGVKSYKAHGKRVSAYDIKDVRFIVPKKTDETDENTEINDNQKEVEFEIIRPKDEDTKV